MNKTYYRTALVDGLKIAYREAGPVDAPTILLLHGFPTSSHMFRELLPLLADRYHVIAPDYPGFGYSSTPAVDEFDYTFEHLVDIVQGFTKVLALERYALYMQDFGGPVGFRLAVRDPARVTALVIQNANAYSEGMSDQVQNWLLQLSKVRSAQARSEAQAIFELPYTKRQYLEGTEDPTRVSPDAWTHAQWGMDRPGNQDIQYALHANYASNFDCYAEWQDYFRRHQPPTLVVWGAGDFVFGVPGARAYQRDLKTIELYILNGAGHFALETHSQEVSQYMRAFLNTHLPDVTLT